MSSKKLRALDPLLHLDINDLLHEESQFIKHLYNLINDHVEPPFAISIDGIWGTGKTTVMQLLQSKLRERGYPVFWFNPWKYSQSADVVLAFLQTLAKEHEPLLQNMKKSGGKILKVLLRVGIGATLKALTQGDVSVGDIKEAFKEEDPTFESYKDMIQEIEHEFNELVEAISQANQQKPLIVFLDDFDRCLPQDAIKLLESLKNLFVTKGCQVVFICGIDTRVAKNFIRDYYKVTDEFAINYFRKIFNLTVSMPYSANLKALLAQHISELYVWDDADEKKANHLAERLIDLGRRAEISSVRKYLNVIHNFFAFLQFHPAYAFDPASEDDFALCLLIVKEAWQPLYEQIVAESLSFDLPTMGVLVERLEGQFSAAQKRILPIFFGKSKPFGEKRLGCELQNFQMLT